MSSILAFLAGGVGVIFFLIVGVAQMIIGYLGIEYHLGNGWAIGLVVASLFFRITFPLTIGTFFGALDVLGWSWVGALLITLPGLVLMVPGALGIAIAGLASKIKGNNQSNYQTNNNYQNQDTYNENNLKDVTPKKKSSSPKKKITKKKSKK